MREFDAQQWVLSLGHHEDKDSLGQLFDWTNRHVLFGQRVHHRSDAGGLSGIKHGEPKTLGPVSSGVCWPGEGERKLAQWSWTFPAQVESVPNEAPGGTAASEPMKFRAVFKATPSGWTKSSNENDKLGELEASTFLGLKFARDFPGSIQAATDLGAQHATFLPAGGVLTAPHRGGPGSLGSWVFELTDDSKLDTTRRAPLQTLTRIQHSPNLGFYGEGFGLALQIGKARHPENGDRIRGSILADEVGADTSGLLVGLGTNVNTNGGPQCFGSMSRHLDGPFRVASCQKHIHGNNADGEQYGATHVQGNTFIHVTDRMDGPMLHSGEVQEFDEGAGKLTQVRFVYYDQLPHDTKFGQKKGKHIWVVPLPEYPTGTGPTETGVETGVIETGIVTGVETGVVETGEVSTGVETGVVVTGVETGVETGEGPQVLISLDRYLYGPFGPARAQVNNPPGGGRTPPGSPGSSGGGVGGIGGAVIQGARELINVNLPQWNHPGQSFVPGFGFKPVHSNPGNPDLRHFVGAYTESMTRFWDSQTPTVMNMQAQGNESGDMWNTTTSGTGSRYEGGTGSGSLWITPPEYDLIDVHLGRVPASYSSTNLALNNAGLGFGTPLTNGGVGSGWLINQSSSDLIFSTTGTTGTKTTTVTVTSTGIGPTNTVTTGTLAARPGATAVGQVYIANDDCNSGGGVYVTVNC